MTSNPDFDIRVREASWSAPALWSFRRPEDIRKRQKTGALQDAAARFGPARPVACLQVCRRGLVALAFSLALILPPLSIFAEDARSGVTTKPQAPPPSLVGVSQMGSTLTAYLRPGGAETVATLTCGENAAVQGWRFTEARRAEATQEVVSIRLESGGQSVWLPVMGAAAGAAAVPAPPVATSDSTRPLPGLDIPASKRGPLHDQMLHRSRLRPQLLQARPRHAMSDLDPFPTRLVFPQGAAR